MIGGLISVEFREKNNGLCGVHISKKDKMKRHGEHDGNDLPRGPLGHQKSKGFCIVYETNYIFHRLAEVLGG